MTTVGGSTLVEWLAAAAGVACCVLCACAIVGAITRWREGKP